MNLGYRWLIIAFIAVLAVLAHGILPSQPSELLTRLIHSLHGPGFLVVTALTFFVIGTQKKKINRYLAAGGISFVISILAELSQIIGPRDAQISDLAVDGIGILGSLGAIAIIDIKLIKGLKIVTRIAVVVATTVLVTGTFIPIISNGYVLFAQRSALPAILTFERNWEQWTYRRAGENSPALIAAPPQWTSEKSTIAKLLEDGPFGILIRVHPAPDWHEFSALSFTASSTTEKSHSITINIRDIPRINEPIGTRVGAEVRVGQIPERYTIQFEQLIQIHGNRPIDFSHIETLVFSATEPGNGISILIDDVRLE